MHCNLIQLFMLSYRILCVISVIWYKCLHIDRVHFILHAFCVLYGLIQFTSLFASFLYTLVIWYECLHINCAHNTFFVACSMSWYRSCSFTASATHALWLDTGVCVTIPNMFPYAGFAFCLCFLLVVVFRVCSVTWYGAYAFLFCLFCAFFLRTCVILTLS